MSATGSSLQALATAKKMAPWWHMGLDCTYFEGLFSFAVGDDLAEGVTRNSAVFRI
jgi:hypothetical protein